ncbi:hypothetical protein J6590_072921 [Homalodisca vitripennis]|nr:hypothetical protein J6590_072921 [Homalodisca vitripennis]
MKPDQKGSSCAGYRAVTRGSQDYRGVSCTLKPENNEAGPLYLQAIVMSRKTPINLNMRKPIELVNEEIAPTVFREPSPFNSGDAKIANPHEGEMLCKHWVACSVRDLGMDELRQTGAAEVDESGEGCKETRALLFQNA